ncbi:hypothetical protein TCON_0477 [Astathelohania contejeani]|uniref:Ricin B lectin domain-containing protein n=1 Tax=Astathelohania contejeani TaxID=164912 RepID=A0ABQ7I1M7_9MICR|nr:hypothetical protein TCON_0477 [Thelohania contejeani]
MPNHIINLIISYFIIIYGVATGVDVIIHVAGRPLEQITLVGGFFRAREVFSEPSQSNKEGNLARIFPVGSRYRITYNGVSMCTKENQNLVGGCFNGVGDNSLWFIEETRVGSKLQNGDKCLEIGNVDNSAKGSIMKSVALKPCSASKNQYFIIRPIGLEHILDWRFPHDIFRDFY